MTFIFRNRTIFWDIPKRNREQTKWDGGSMSYDINNINLAATIIGNDMNTNATLCSELIWVQMAFKKDCGLNRHFMYMYFCQIK